MRKVNNLPINGIIESLSAPIEHVEPGMFFHFDGKTLSVYPHDPLSNVQIMDIVFNDMQSNKELQRQKSEHLNDIFKTITTDNL